MRAAYLHILWAPAPATPSRLPLPSREAGYYKGIHTFSNKGLPLHNLAPSVILMISGNASQARAALNEKLAMDIDLNSDVIVSKCTNLTFSDLDYELILLSPSMGRVFSLNKTARYIWNSIDEPISFGHIVAQMTAIFEVGEEECRRETARLIRELVDLNLLSLDPPC